ncbi:hypothetical protein BS78_02G109700 [Paspalum vaginatum]|nr:hypothetical protein BS78_02G109700 [Paspalum vaginatum]
MASVGFGTVAPAAAASPARSSRLGGRAARPSTARIIPAATKVVTAAAGKKQQKQEEEKGLFDAIFGALYKEEQLLETDPILNKVGGKAAPASPWPKKAAAAAAEESGNGGFSFGGLFSKK